MKSISEYVASIADGLRPESGEVFAKILADNDDSGRHGVVIPMSAYAFFPELSIPDPKANATLLFQAKEASTAKSMTIAWKYYQRYPERRTTRLPKLLNDRDSGRRLVIFTRIVDKFGVTHFVVDALVEDRDSRFPVVLDLLFGAGSQAVGAYVNLPLDVGTFRIDDDLAALLDEFDEVKSRGWIPSLRSGDTGIGYTFETLLGIEENNDQTADFRGIEIKCKLDREAASPSGKINLFQLGPTWRLPGPMRLRLDTLGELAEDGRLSCYSQVTTTPNNKQLWLRPSSNHLEVDLLKAQTDVGFWTRQRLSERLTEKHSRAVFIKAARRTRAGIHEYHYRELIYCERPDVDRFLDMVAARRIVFEFAMHASGTKVRNHGYPWRLVDERELDQLFALQVQLRLKL